jgi:lipoate-protein ligase A
MLVLGSSQHINTFNIDKIKSLSIQDLTVVKRRSGGGAVLAIPDSFFWFNLLIPAEDKLYEPNLTKSFDWLGQKLYLTLKKLKFGTVQDLESDLRVNKSKLTHNPAGKLWCFMDSNYGEIFVQDKKLVGISQRRTKYGSCYSVGINIKSEFEIMWLLTRSLLTRSSNIQYCLEEPVGHEDSIVFEFENRIAVFEMLDTDSFIQLFLEELDRR